MWRMLRAEGYEPPAEESREPHLISLGQLSDAR